MVDVKIIGSGLCMTALRFGEVSLFNFLTGEHIYSLNTHTVYKYPQ